MRYRSEPPIQPCPPPKEAIAASQQVCARGFWKQFGNLTGVRVIDWFARRKGHAVSASLTMPWESAGAITAKLTSPRVTSFEDVSARDYRRLPIASRRSKARTRAHTRGSATKWSNGRSGCEPRFKSGSPGGKDQYPAMAHCRTRGRARRHSGPRRGEPRVITAQRPRHPAVARCSVWSIFWSQRPQPVATGGE
jgi:hypothetical protein